MNTIQHSISPVYPFKEYLEDFIDVTSWKELVAEGDLSSLLPVGFILNTTITIPYPSYSVLFSGISVTRRSSDVLITIPINIDGEISTFYVVLYSGHTSDDADLTYTGSIAKDTDTVIKARISINGEMLKVLTDKLNKGDTFAFTGDYRLMDLCIRTSLESVRLKTYLDNPRDPDIDIPQYIIDRDAEREELENDMDESYEEIDTTVYDYNITRYDENSGNPYIDGGFSGDVVLGDGYNLETRLEGSKVVFISGAGFGLGIAPIDFCGSLQSNAPKGIVPSKGNMDIVGDECHPVNIVVPTESLILMGNCKACCDCADYSNVLKAIQLLGDKWDTAWGKLVANTNAYKTLNTKFNDKLEGYKRIEASGKGYINISRDAKGSKTGAFHAYFSLTVHDPMYYEHYYPPLNQQCASLHVRKIKVTGIELSAPSDTLYSGSHYEYMMHQSISILVTPSWYSQGYVDTRPGAVPGRLIQSGEGASNIVINTNTSGTSSLLLVGVEQSAEYELRAGLVYEFDITGTLLPGGAPAVVNADVIPITVRWDNFIEGPEAIDNPKYDPNIVNKDPTWVTVPVPINYIEPGAMYG